MLAMLTMLIHVYTPLYAHLYAHRFACFYSHLSYRHVIATSKGVH
jgi:hypothetical protein